MSAIIPFDTQLPTRRTLARIPGFNQEILSGSGANFPFLSIKGKTFTLVKGKEKKILTREVDGEEEAVQSLTLAVVRANRKYRVFYATQFTEGESEGKKPTCFSQDGVAPDASATEPQSRKCQGCPQNVWGVRDGVGTACSSKTRLAVVDPNNLDAEPILLSVPAASRKSFAQVVEAAEMRQRDFNELAIRVSFDKEAAAPKLVFKPIGWLSDSALATVQALFENEIVREMVGVAHPVQDEPHASVSELEAAIATRKVVSAAKALPAKAPEVAAEVEDVAVKTKTEKPKKTAKPEAAHETDSLLAEMDALLGNKDD